jgi:hypothetical protein
MIGMHGVAFTRGCGSGRRSAALACALCRHVGVIFELGLEEPAMFRLPAYDPVVIAWVGIGLLAVATLVFIQ